VEFGGDPIDITSDDSSGRRELLEEPSQRQIDLSVSGVTKSAVLRSAYMAGEFLEEMTVTYADGGVLSGDFFLASYSDTGPYNDGQTFEASFQSSGPVTYTPPAP
jgi:predicted secreted protein